MSPTSPLVVVGVATRLRPDGLRRLGASLAAQTGLHDVRPALVIVDNDPAGSSRAVADELGTALAWPVTYDVEPDPGIPAARRRTVALAQQADADAVVFLDDDEIARSTWLATLVSHWRSSGADLVTGPSHRLLPPDAPGWTRHSTLFDPTGRIRTGTRVAKAYTNNLLVSRGVLDALPVPFDDAFRFTGSSDLHFSLRARRAGFTIEWCEEAVVDEHVDAQRLTWGWYARRAYRSGAGDAVARSLLGGSGAVPGILARGALRAGHGLALSLPALLWPPLRPLAVQRLLSGIGTFAGLAGRNYEEYRGR